MREVEIAIGKATQSGATFIESHKATTNGTMPVSAIKTNMVRSPKLLLGSIIFISWLLVGLLPCGEGGVS